MKNQLSDEQIDQFMRTLISEAAIDDKAVNEIADSPTIWWGVQRQIAEQKAAVKSPWPPAILRRLFLIASPMAAAAALIILFFVFWPADRNSGIASGPQESEITQPGEVRDTNVVANPKPFLPPAETRVKISRPEILQPKSVRSFARSIVRPAVKSSNLAKTTKATVFKSEFIALSYAGSAESGQIVRVKVPSSMMVSLGLVASVNKSSDLVDAEVIVGDDGLTRAIRFIR